MGKTVGAMLLPINEQEQILLVQYNAPQRPPVHQKWSFAGGIVEPGEQPHDAAVREAYEELGVQATITDPRPIVGTTGEELDLLLLGYLAQLETTSFVLDTNELLQAEWFSRDEIKELDTLSLTIPMCEQAFEIHNQKQKSSK